MKNKFKVLFFLLILYSVTGCVKPKNADDLPQSEINLLYQLDLYLKSSYEGNYEEIVRLTSPLLFEYMINNDKSGMQKSKSEVHLSYKRLCDETQLAVRNRDLKVNYEIGDIVRTIILKPYLFKIVEVNTIVLENNTENSIKDEIISISQNDGESWTFLTNDNDIIIDILSLKFDKESIKKILGKDLPKERITSDVSNINNDVVKSHTFKNSEVIYKNFNTNEEVIMKDSKGITISKLKNGNFVIKDQNKSIQIKFSYIEDENVYVYEIVEGYDSYYDRVKSGKDFNEISDGNSGKYSIDSEKSPDVWIFKLK